MPLAGSKVAIQQLYIQSRDEMTDNCPASLGSREEVLSALAERNTAPDAEGEDTLHGPGIRIELPPDEPVRQMIVTIIEDEIAWQVIERLGNQLHWKLIDPTTGREWCP